MKKPEELAREDIDAALRLARWEVQDLPSLDIDAARGVAIREYPLKSGHGFADYLLYVDGEAGLPKPVYLSDRFVHSSSDTGLQRTPMLRQSTAQERSQSLTRRPLALLAWLFLLVAPWGCASSRTNDPDIVRPAPGAPLLQTIPGPMLGPFNSLPSALLAACNKIMRKPHATAGRPDQQDSATRWRFSSEYCAWIYYTPDHKYVISKLTDQSRVDPTQRTKTCVLPSEVEDPRFPPDSIKYIYALHNHPMGSTVSEFDIRFIISEALRHGFKSETKDGTHHLSLVAFFARGTVEPTCDGFHQYIPAWNLLLTWTRQTGRWDCKQTGLVIVDESRDTIDIKRINADCPGGSVP